MNQLAVVHDARDGDGLPTWIRRREGATATEGRHPRLPPDTIAHDKVPRTVRLVDAVPMAVTSKVHRYLMREQSIADLGLSPTADTA